VDDVNARMTSGKYSGTAINWLGFGSTIMHACYERFLRAMHAFLFYKHILDYSRPLVVDGSRSLSGGEYDWHISNARPACEGAYGAQRPGRDQAWKRPRRSAQRCPLQSLLVSISSITKVRLTRIKTGINTISSRFIASEPNNRELSLDHTYHQSCFLMINIPG